MGMRRSDKRAIMARVLAVVWLHCGYSAPCIAYAHVVYNNWLHLTLCHCEGAAKLRSLVGTASFAQAVRTLIAITTSSQTHYSNANCNTKPPTSVQCDTPRNHLALPLLFATQC
eukprot:10467-Heterococcus_DN1.PRE.1